MNKLFSGVDINLGNKDTLSTEMIDIQKNDAVVPMLEKEFQNLIDISKEYEFNFGKTFFKHSKSKKIIKRIDEILYERFNIQFKHINGEGMGYGIFTAPPVNYNVLNRDIEEIYASVGEEITPDKDADEDVTDFNTNSRKVYAKWLANMESINKKLNTDGVYIDLHKARINGLPKDYRLTIIADFNLLINKVKLTAKELVAVLFHEVGHGFTHIEYSYRAYTVTNVLTDTLKENILKKNKSSKEVLYLTYKELDGEDDISKDNAVVALIKTLVLIKNKALLTDTKSEHSTIDSEQLADQFAGRFGLSPELASGLDKLTEAYSLKKPENFITFITPLLMMILIVFLQTMNLTVSLTIVFVSIFVNSLIYSAMTLGGTNEKLTYDDIKQRIQRQLNEQIRQLRTLDLDKKETKAMIENIETIKKIVDKQSIKIVGPVDMLVRLFTYPISSKYVNYREMEQLIENLSENELHVSGRKLQTLV